MKKKISSILFLLVFSFSCFAEQGASAAAANRRTALRCLNQASYSVTGLDWESAMSHSELGISYDDGISDLYYILAISKASTGCNNAEVLPYVEKALEINNWVDYNRDGARVLYADILCNTRRYSEVSNILDSAPFLYSADAEFIRAKSYYRIGTNESIKKAREKIDSARRIYPDDTRFPLLFFKNESPSDTDSEVKRLSSFFIKQVAQYVEASPDKDAELEIYAALFADGMDREHLLKSFSARGLKHVLYSRVALESGLISEKAALEDFMKFAESGVTLLELQNFVSLLTDVSVIEKLHAYFNAFDGIIYIDPDGDGISNIRVKYLRGRPAEIVYDDNQDGLIKWNIECDFGLPVKCSVVEENAVFVWDGFPYLKNISYKDEAGKESYGFTLVSESFGWTPVFIVQNDFLFDSCGLSLYVPVLNPLGVDVKSSELISVASELKIASHKEENVIVNYMLLNGEFISSRYYKDGVLFAQCQFKNNIPDIRVIDRNNDGVFETTEFYSESVEQSAYTENDDSEFMADLLGINISVAPFRLKMIQIDRDGNTVPDFTEEYLTDGGKIASWDNDEDGLWEVRYVSYGLSYDESGNALPLKEDSLFYEKPSGKLVVISFSDGIPVGVKSGDETFSVVKDPLVNFYWIGKSFNSLMAESCIRHLKAKNIQGECLIIEHEGKRIICVQIGGTYFGQVMPDVDLTK